MNIQSLTSRCSLKRFTHFSAMLTLLALPALLHADSFVQTNLVSPTPGEAITTDANLVNPWGMAYSATSPFWISNQGTGTSTLYDGAGNTIPLVVNVPGGAGPAAGPTGQVFSGGAGFGLSNGGSAAFIFDTLQGTIAGWNGASGTSAITEVTTPGASYTGLALGSSGGANYLYAADAATGQIRVFNTSFAPVSLAGHFVDPNAMPGFTPFNIQLIGSQLYVTYASLDRQGNDLPGGYVDVFSTDGTFVSRFATGGALSAPWGVTLASSTFGSFANDLLIGNNGNGEINAFNPLSGAYVGTVDGANGQPLVNNDLWALGFRTGGSNDNTSALYFTAGDDPGGVGLFGDITPAPEPGSLMLAAFGMTGVGLVARNRKRR
jgi:uncharacterized protein (TIGR03118 family)